MIFYWWDQVREWALFYDVQKILKLIEKKQSNTKKFERFSKREDKTQLWKSNKQKNRKFLGLKRKKKSRLMKKLISGDKLTGN